MLLKMIVKLLFKVTVPLLIIAGLYSYGLYLKGGDPLAMWKGFGSGVKDQFASLYFNVKDDASTAVQAVAKIANVDVEGVKLGKLESTEVFTWKDANGVTHYSAIAPTGVGSRKMSINPNTNVVPPILIPKPKQVDRRDTAKQSEQSQNILSPSAARNERKDGARQAYSDPAVQEVADQLGGELPGVVGQILSSQGGVGEGLNRVQLLKMLQQ